jgi:hypothetical protein
MSDLHAFRAWTNERLHDKLMDEPWDLRLSIKVEAWISVRCLRLSKLHHPATSEAPRGLSIKTANPPQIRDFVSIFVIRYG